MKYLFDDFLLDTDCAELRRGRDEVPLEPRAYSLLCLLVEARDRVLPWDEIVDRVWEGRIISDAALSTLLKTLRHAIGDSGANQRLVRTIRRRGFRFIAEVKVQVPAAPVQPASVLSSAGGDQLAILKPDGCKPSFMMLPFQLIGGRGHFAVVADSIPHDLIQGLSRLRWLRVIARGTAFRFRGLEPDIA